MPVLISSVAGSTPPDSAEALPYQYHASVYYETPLGQGRFTSTGFRVPAALQVEDVPGLARSLANQFIAQGKSVVTETLTILAITQLGGGRQDAALENEPDPLAAGCEFIRWLNVTFPAEAPHYLTIGPEGDGFVSTAAGRHGVRINFPSVAELPALIATRYPEFH
jgi:hypothetical protein